MHVSYVGQCALLTQQECTMRAGTFMTSSQLCSEVNCLGQSCSLKDGETLAADPVLKNQPKIANQWWRIFTSLFIFNGAIDAIIVLLIQFFIGNEIERTAGWLRISFIYFGSAAGGVIFALIFSPYEVSAGAEPGLFGLLAVLIIEVGACDIYRYFFVPIPN